MSDIRYIQIWCYTWGCQLGKVESFSYSGLDLWFNSSDHLPQHLHVRKPDAWEIRVYFLLCEQGWLEFDVKWPPNPRGPTAREQKRLLELILDHRAGLLKEWETKVCH